MLVRRPCTSFIDWDPTDLYYTNQRHIQHQNTPCEDLSPYAKRFFTVFLDQRAQFKPPEGSFYFSTFKSNLLTFRLRVLDLWSTIGRHSKLGVIVFRCILGVHSRSTASMEKPYFEKFMKLISLHGKSCSQISQRGCLYVGMMTRTYKSKLFHESRRLIKHSNCTPQSTF